jgi:hypothetical protein
LIFFGCDFQHSVLLDWLVAVGVAWVAGSRICCCVADVVASVAEAKKGVACFALLVTGFSSHSYSFVSNE